ncbi:MAG: polysaccharide pyruvyl transferase family protein [Candidatus Paceibacterota bacterium]
MKNKIKILIINVSYLNHNYGAQGLVFSLTDQLNKYLDAEYTLFIREKYYEKNLSFANKYGFNIVPFPRLAGLFRKEYINVVKEIKKSDVIINLAGIEFFGNNPPKLRWKDYIDVTVVQFINLLFRKPYFRFTSSYGPFPDRIYKFFVKRALNNLPFVFVRGEENLKDIQELKLKAPVYSFPEVSIGLVPENKDWANSYINNLGLDLHKSIVGFSPSAVINRISPDHIKLCKEIIAFFQSKNRQILLIPHSIEDGIDLRSCDLALCRKIYSELKNKKNVFIVSDTSLTYKQARAIVGLLEFYITGRYHGLSSALSIAVPVISLSWHKKYRDMMSLFLDDFLTVDCKTTSISDSVELIKKYYEDRKWFNKEKVLKRKNQIIEQIDRSVEILIKEIKKCCKI